MKPVTAILIACTCILPLAAEEPVADPVAAATAATRTYLGVVVDTVGPDIAKHLGLEPGVGLIVRQVPADTPAQAAGIVEDDILVKLDDQLLLLPRQLQLLVKRLEPGREVTLTYRRAGKEATATATLAAREVTPEELAREAMRDRLGRDPFMHFPWDGLADGQAVEPPDGWSAGKARAHAWAIPGGGEGKVIWRGKPKVFVGGNHTGLRVEMKDGKVTCTDQDGKVLYQSEVGEIDPRRAEMAKRLAEEAEAAADAALAEARVTTGPPDLQEMVEQMRRRQDEMQRRMEEMLELLKELKKER